MLHVFDANFYKQNIPFNPENNIINSDFLNIIKTIKSPNRWLILETNFGRKTHESSWDFQCFENTNISFWQSVGSKISIVRQRFQSFWRRIFFQTEYRTDFELKIVPLFFKCFNNVMSFSNHFACQLTCYSDEVVLWLPPSFQLWTWLKEIPGKMTAR